MAQHFDILGPTDCVYPRLKQWMAILGTLFFHLKKWPFNWFFNSAFDAWWDWRRRQKYEGTLITNNNQSNIQAQSSTTSKPPDQWWWIIVDCLRSKEAGHAWMNGWTLHMDPLTHREQRRTLSWGLSTPSASQKRSSEQHTRTPGGNRFNRDWSCSNQYVPPVVQKNSQSG